MVIKIGGKKIQLVYTLDTMDRVQAMNGGDALDVRGLVEKMRDRTFLVRLLVEMAKDANVQVPDEKWLKGHIYPGQLPTLQIAIMETITEAMNMETLDGDDDDEEVDEILEELKKKETTGG